MTNTKPTTTPATLPSVERVKQELGSAKSLDDFFGKEGIFARLFADTLEQMLGECKIEWFFRISRALGRFYMLS